jgi:hypothetical protein
VVPDFAGKPIRVPATHAATMALVHGARERERKGGSREPGGVNTQ